MNDTVSFFRRCGLFRGLDDERLQTLTQAAEDITRTSGSEIFTEGDPGDAMFVVLAGAVQVYTRDRNGREVVLARLGPGDYFGEQALLPGGTGRRNASVRAAEPVRLARVAQNLFQSVLSESDALRERLVEIGVEQLRNNLQQLSPLARGIGLDNVATLRRRLEAGEILFRQGDDADALYFVSAGRLSAWREENGARTLIGYVERAGCVGELALMRRDRRSATVIADEPSEVVGIPRSSFETVYRDSAAVREHLATLQRAYELPQRGILTQHTGTFAGHDCITTLYHLKDGSVVTAYRVVGQPLYAVERLGATSSETLTWKDAGRSRELRIAKDGTLTGLTVNGEWPDVHTFHLFVLDGGRVGATERQTFLRTGRFDIAASAAPEIVCHCVNVTGATLRQAIKNGATTFTRLQEITSCGSVCGGCVPAVAEMLGLEEWVLADVVAEREEAPGIRSFELVPREASYPEAAPGQHIVVEGVVNGLRIRRPYTLSSARRHGGRIRITVKREDGGAFSPWLFDGRPKAEPLRITRPRGEYMIDLTGGPAVCFVAGIGVTPALAAAATAVNDSETRSPLLIHYSGRSLGQMAGVPELESAAQTSPIELVVRETSRQGRLNPDEVAELAARFPKADWYLCGPSSYLHEVGQMLKLAHVAGDRIHVEDFTPVGILAATAEERTAFVRHLLVKPTLSPRKPLVRMLRRVGRALNTVANGPIYPLRWIENRLSRASRIDAAMPLEYMALVSALSRGPYEYQMRGFARLAPMGAANREKSRSLRAEGRALPPNTPDGETFAYWMPAAPFPKFPKAGTVDTGWTRISANRLVPTYVTRSRTVLEHLLRRSEHSDRGPLPYHFAQQLLGRMDVPSCPGRKAAGLFGGQFHDNATWTEDRELTADMFGFTAIDAYGTGMASAAKEVCVAIDEVIARDPNIVVDLNVLLAKTAYTIIVRAVFGNVDLAEMHALGRTLSDSIHKALAYMWEFVMGRQSVPTDYVESLQAAHRVNRRIIDLLRDLDSKGKLNDNQRNAPVVRMILETAGAPDGAYERLYAIVLPLIIAGHETTGHAMTWALYEIGRNSALEKSVLSEIEGFQAIHGKAPLSTEDYDERPVALAMLAECLRRHPPIQGMPRTTIHDGVVPPDPETGIGGFQYPAGAMIMFSFIAVHLDPRRWPDPYAFRLERWMDGIRDDQRLREKGRIVRANIRAREQALDWLPFSDGPGRCVGQNFNTHEFIVILDALLPRYRFELVDPTDEIPHTETMVVGPEPGRMAVRIRPRHPAEN